MKLDCSFDSSADNNSSMILDSSILDVFESEDERFYFPISRQGDARAFVKQLHRLGFDYETLSSELEEAPDNFKSWRKGLGRAGVGQRVMDRINRPVFDMLEDLDNLESNYNLRHPSENIFSTNPSSIRSSLDENANHYLTESNHNGSSNRSSETGFAHKVKRKPNGDDSLELEEEHSAPVGKVTDLCTFFEKRATSVECEPKSIRCPSSERNNSEQQLLVEQMDLARNICDDVLRNALDEANADPSRNLSVRNHDNNGSFSNANNKDQPSLIRENKINKPSHISDEVPSDTTVKAPTKRSDHDKANSEKEISCTLMKMIPHVESRTDSDNIDSFEADRPTDPWEDSDKTETLGENRNNVSICKETKVIQDIQVNFADVGLLEVASTCQENITEAKDPDQPVEDTQEPAPLSINKNPNSKKIKEKDVISKFPDDSSPVNSPDSGFSNLVANESKIKDTIPAEQINDEGFSNQTNIDLSKAKNRFDNKESTEEQLSDEALRTSISSCISPTNSSEINPTLTCDLSSNLTQDTYPTNTENFDTCLSKDEPKLSESVSDGEIQDVEIPESPNDIENVTENYSSDYDLENYDPLTSTCHQLTKMKHVLRSSRSLDGPGYIFAFTDSSNDSSQHRVKIGCSRQPYKRLQQATLFNVDIKLVSAVHVGLRREALADILGKLTTYTIDGTKDWFLGPLDDILQIVMDTSIDYPLN